MDSKVVMELLDYYSSGVRTNNRNFELHSLQQKAKEIIIFHYIAIILNNKNILPYRLVDDIKLFY